MACVTMESGGNGCLKAIRMMRSVRFTGRRFRRWKKRKCTPGHIVKSKAILSATELGRHLKRRLRMSDQDIRTFVIKRRKSDRVTT